ncbi:hypothetical protein Aduo_018702 [Ancylostoma duodenale]
MNYLLEALQGPAKYAVKDLQITADNYDVAIQILKRGYDNSEAVVAQLLQNLHDLQPRSSKIADQRQMLDRILPIISQLKQKGENTNTQHMRRTILAKFTDKVQRSMLKKKANIASDEWTTLRLLSDLQEFFDMEDQIQHLRTTAVESVKMDSPSKTPPGKKTKYVRSDDNKKPACFYCNKNDHTPRFCPEYSTYEQRIGLIRQRNLCRNCGSVDHRVNECPRGTCRQCNEKGHHTSLCWKSSKPEPPAPKLTKDIHPKAQQTAKKTSANQNFAVIVAKQSSASCKIDDHTILPKQETPCPQRNHVDLLIGQVRIWNNRTQEFEDVHMILDTGAEQSFITNDYADRLALKDGGQLQLTMQTFGNSSPTERVCGTTTVEIEDRQGTRHSFDLAKIDYIAGDTHRSYLSEADRKYLMDNNIHLSISPQIRTLTKPILLGCADLFELLDQGLGQAHNLPSGLKLLHFRIGYLVTGRNSFATKRSNVQLNMIRSQTSPNDDELMQWDQYWTLDSAGVDEYSGPQALEKRELNDKIWAQFRATVERNENGYHVRLPWKDAAQDLPDNRAIAYNRLKGIRTKFKDQPDILRQYHKTFQDQLETGVIEEVDETAPPDGEIVHYLAHQAVITPQKDTTKLRIVFDGSAHYRNAPCLNDKLHQGPVILPSLVDMLIRFRIGNIGIISDVEKAFLQVHLQKRDRDATRCLWMRDIDKPVDPSNVIAYRFTRVTFGLNCSPFLLGATIAEHLDNTPDKEMATLIKNNVYVDNLLMTASTPEEALQRCQKARQIFSEINMNLREFRTNCREVNEGLPVGTLGQNLQPKVLGIKWDSEADTMNIESRYPDKSTITKRTVSEQVASLYDPLGWLTPLTLNAKILLQNLWKYDYKWDQELSDEHQREWRHILPLTQGFAIQIPRKASEGTKTPARLVAFADASKHAMAACVYLVTSSTMAVPSSSLRNRSSPR